MAGGRTGYGHGVPMPGCELQDLLLPALRNRLKPFEPVVSNLPLTSTLVEKMVTGRLRKHLAEITLLGQPFVKDGDVTVGKLLASKGASVKGFTRLAVGEGIEKKEENFADEVMQQVAGN